MKNQLGIFRVLLLLSVFGLAPATAQDRPNILVIWGDDIGVHNVSAYNNGVMGYETPINHLRAKVREAVQQVDLLMARQGRLLEIVAIDELIARRGRLENYRDKARFALADSYDRATQAQARSDEP